MQFFKIGLIPLGLIMVFLQLLPLGESPPEEPKKEPPVKGWWMVSYFTVPPTQYSRAGKGIIRADSRGSRSSLFKEVKEEEQDFPVLTWKWKISNVVHSAIETRKDRFDTAARVMVVFVGTMRPGRIEGVEPWGPRIEYIWASQLPRGHIFNHPGGKNHKVFVLESGDSRAGQWVEERRNLHKDFKAAFGTEPTGVLSIGIQTDTDHSNEMVTAYYSEPTLRQ